MGKIMVQGQARQMFTTPHLDRKSLVWWRAPGIPATEGSINRRIAVQASLGKK
jgi:hypothetical protein